MASPPGFLEELRTHLSLSQVVGHSVAWDQRKSNPGKGDMWAPRPFHHEKTPSFHVDDQKGYYFCFGCQAKGEAINFIQPKFSSWGKEVLCQVVDVDPITVFGNFDNG